MIKKILFFMILVLFCVPVYASNSKIYFTESEGRIYFKDYDGTFMKHTEMLPGNMYTDTLEIENDTTINYKLFLRLIDSSTSDESSELLDYLNMKIYLDDSLIYEGNSKGLVYIDGEYMLEDILKIGNMIPKSKHILKVETTLSKEYTNKSNNDFSFLTWDFYAQYDELTKPIQIDKVPNTYDALPIWIISVVVCLVIMIISLYQHRKISRTGV